MILIMFSIDMLKNCDFSCLTAYDCEKKIINNLEGFCGKWEHGATKLVLIPEDTEYVIKIPFCGTMVKNWFWYDDVAKDPPRVLMRFREAGGYIKEWDYCAAEAYKYERLKELGLEKFFVEIIPLQTKLNYPIYLQQKVSYFACDSNPFIEPVDLEECDIIKEVYNKYTANNNPTIDFHPAWFAQIYRQYGLSELEKLLMALNELDIADLRAANLGYTCYKNPVIVDYGGYSDGFTLE